MNLKILNNRKLHSDVIWPLIVGGMQIKTIMIWWGAKIFLPERGHHWDSWKECRRKNHFDKCCSMDQWSEHMTIKGGSHHVIHTILNSHWKKEIILSLLCQWIVKNKTKQVQNAKRKTPLNPECHRGREIKLIVRLFCKSYFKIWTKLPVLIGQSWLGSLTPWSKASYGTQFYETVKDLTQ